MKRAIKRWILLSAAFMFVGTAALAQQPMQPASPPGGPQDEKNGTGVVPSGVKLVPAMPASGPPTHFQFPRAATKTLANGLRVFVVTDHGEPAVAVRLVALSAGSVKDPQGIPGVAQMTANLLTQGTAKRSAKDIAEAIDFIGGSLEASASKDSTDVSLDVVKKDLATGLDLMSDVVLHPAFRSEELDRQRQQLLSSLTVQYSDPDFLASAAFSRVVYGSSPYGWPEQGTPETLTKLDPAVLAKFHDANYAPNQSLLAFAGDITPEEAFAAAEKYFGLWPKVDVASAVPPAPETVAGMHIWLIDKPDAVQTQIRAGKLGIRRGDPDYIPVAVMNRIFGGGYNSRLNTEVRVKKGLTYSAYSSFNPHRLTGSFAVGTYTRTEATVEAAKLVVDLIAKMSTGDVTPQEMDFARDYLAGVYPIQSETSEDVANRVLTVAAFGLPADYNSTYPDKIRSVTSAQVRDMAMRYLSAKDLDLVFAGNVSAFRDALKKAFPDAKYEEIAFDQVDLLSPDLRKAKVASATNASIEQGKRIVLAAARASGGETLASLAALKMTEDGKIFRPDGDTERSVKWLVSYPDRARGEFSLSGKSIVQVCDGHSAWVEMGTEMRDATPMTREFLRAISLYGGGWGLYREILGGKISDPAIWAIGDEEIAGKKTTGVAVDAPFGTVKLYFDTATHLLVAARYQSAGAQGASDNEQRWSDYRTVEGRQFAFSTVVYRDGTKYMESTIQQLDLNPKVDDALFAMPAGPNASAR
ncbi:MAG TPA: pitrilysin family protein [Candidatus Acidoferrales bacterium]